MSEVDMFDPYTLKLVCSGNFRTLHAKAHLKCKCSGLAKESGWSRRLTFPNLSSRLSGCDAM